MLENYFPVLLFIGIAFVMGIAPILLGMLVGPNRQTRKSFLPTSVASKLLKMLA